MCNGNQRSIWTRRKREKRKRERERERHGFMSMPTRYPNLTDKGVSAVERIGLYPKGKIPRAKRGAWRGFARTTIGTFLSLIFFSTCSFLSNLFFYPFITLWSKFNCKSPLCTHSLSALYCGLGKLPYPH